MTAKKKFDCVEMKHKGAVKVQARLTGMSREQQLEYWRVRTDELLDYQRKVIQERKVS